MAGSGELLLDLETAKDHLRVFGTTEDALVEMYLQMAQGLVINRLECVTTDSLVLATIAEWDAETVPAGVKAAILQQCGELYRFRGDDEKDPAGGEGRLSDRVERYLGQWRQDFPIA